MTVSELHPSHRGSVRGARTSPLRVQMSRVVAALVVLDVTVLVATLATAGFFRERLDGVLSEVSATATLGSWLTPWIFAVWMACLVGRGAYIRHNLGTGVEEFRQVASGSAIAFGIICSLAFLSHSSISRGFFLLCFLMGAPLLLAERYAARRVIKSLRRRGHLRGRVIAVCAPGALSEVLDTISRAPDAGYSVVGTCVPDNESGRNVDLPVPCFGGVDDILSACREAGADTVMVAGGGSPTSRALREIGWELEGTDIDLVVVPSLIDVAGPRIHLRQVSGLPLVHVEEPQAGRAGGLPKRMFDIVGAALLIIAFTPLLAWAALRIKLHDGGSVLFRQTRIGRDGQPFSCLKFRSMVADAEQLVADLQKDEAQRSAVQDGGRPAGHQARSVDPPPLHRRAAPALQRAARRHEPGRTPPAAPAEVARYDSDMSRRLRVRPGMTGLWQVSGPLRPARGRTGPPRPLLRRQLVDDPGPDHPGPHRLRRAQLPWRYRLRRRWNSPRPTRAEDRRLPGHSAMRR